MRSNPYKAEFLLIFNILLALTMLLNRNLSEVYSGLIVLYGLYRIFIHKNRDGSAHIFAAYSMGIEVLFRMNSGGLGYEWGKYAAVLLLMTGFLVEKLKKDTPVIYLMFIALMIPSIFVIDYPTFDRARQMVSFNLSGPVTLAVSSIYFYKRRMTPAQLRKLLLSILYPIAAMSVFIYFRSGDLEAVEFTTESNFQASGGFGPNQVSTIFGLGILVIAIAHFQGIRLFRLKYINVILLFAFLIRGLATFSRGGMLAPLLAIVFCIIIMTFLDANFQTKLNRVVYAFMFVFVIGVLGFNYVNDVSGGLLEMRFKGESMYNKEKSNIFSGRDEIFSEDIEIFERNILVGVGPGMSMEKRAEISGIETAAHIEYSRLLAEHGVFGIIAILIIIIFPIKFFLETKSTDNRIMLILCITFVFFTMGHAAMRTAAPGFIYGMAFINIIRRRE